MEDDQFLIPLKTVALRSLICGIDPHVDKQWLEKSRNKSQITSERGRSNNVYKTFNPYSSKAFPVVSLRLRRVLADINQSTTVKASWYFVVKWQFAYEHITLILTGLVQSPEGYSVHMVG